MPPASSNLTEPLPTAAAARRALEAKNIATFEKWRDETFSPQRALWAKRWQQENPRFDLPLLLPSGQKQVIEQDLKKSLEAISNYDAAEFRKLLIKMP